MYYAARPSTVPPLGVLQDGESFTVAICAPAAEHIDFCVAVPSARSPRGDESDEIRLPLRFVEQGIHYDRFDGMGELTAYGFRAHGPWDPDRGCFYNPAKLLIDPYARGLSEVPLVSSAMFPTAVDSMFRPVSAARSREDSAGATPYSVIVDTAFDWQDVPRPRTPMSETVIYEAHVRGLTMLHPQVPRELRGTYLGLSSEPVIEHLRSLGVTAVELLPVHTFLSEPHLVSRGLSNYWGYNTAAFFAPDARYATSAARSQGATAVLREFKTMVRELHRAGVEVILDVVYNHTAEGGQDGPLVSLRGLDNHLYHRLQGGDYLDFTGCGNSLDFRQLPVLRLALDSLRYFADQCRIDGFRFDLMTTLARDTDGFRPDHPFLQALRSDPVLSTTKLIAEPWDVGAYGWQTGAFPAGIAEWNDRFRDDVRSMFLRPPHGARSALRDLASRLSGSEDVLRGSDPFDLPPGRSLRTPAESVNFVTSHDGFTLYDLTAYETKRNEVNGEGNRDGTGHNRSYNHGVEGDLHPSDAGFDALMRRRVHSLRNLLGMMFLSAGTPMLTAGDEFARTQMGNNNAYCQDNELSWVHWERAHQFGDLLETARHLARLRREHPELRPRNFLGRDAEDEPRPDRAGWFDGAGVPITHEGWRDDTACVLQLVRTTRGVDRALVVVVHRGDTPATVQLPPISAPEGAGLGTVELLWSSAWDRPRPVTRPADRMVVAEPMTLQVLRLTL